ncbi:hypothetical protein RJ640_025709 [Escallonia rubra]|uniref:Vacuolar protein sorting-associated protein 29 n=1 Tax=Escallonia rubra TaxID=112253 RepID=A0AA88R1Q6_9ASTE|nr:hypothetical protein RJ640_025709 [Escallonia rubra]
MVLVLAIGDLHIPHRAPDLPAKFKSMLVPGKIQRINCTGNVCIKDYNAKLSDFRLAKDSLDGDNTHVSTFVMGTYGNAAPAYVMTEHVKRRTAASSAPQAGPHPLAALEFEYCTPGILTPK